MLEWAGRCPGEPFPLVIIYIRKLSLALRVGPAVVATTLCFVAVAIAPASLDIVSSDVFAEAVARAVQHGTDKDFLPWILPMSSDRCSGVSMSTMKRVNHKIHKTHEK